MIITAQTNAAVVLAVRAQASAQIGLAQRGCVRVVARALEPKLGEWQGSVVVFGRIFAQS